METPLEQEVCKEMMQRMGWISPKICSLESKRRDLMNEACETEHALIRTPCHYRVDMI